MNVYEKLNEARVKFHSKGIKQNGKNDFAHYTYFELSDILPAVNEINRELKSTCVVKFDKDLAILEFIDCEKPEDKVVFTSPMSTASLKGCHEVQNVGAVESYLKRYLYQNCFEIAESDVLDATMNPNTKPIQKNQQTQQQIKRADNVDNSGKLRELLERYPNSISDTVKGQCEQALNMKDSKQIDSMLCRLYAYLEKKGIRL